MEKYNCLIVEDEPISAEVLEDYVKQIPHLNLKGVCSDAFYAMEALQKEKIDVLFLDINLPKISGLEFVKTLNSVPQVIITTAYREYALEGYELNVVDYLLKPINFNRFLMAVNKLRAQGTPEVVFSSSQVNSPQGEKPYLFINVNKKRIRVFLDEILYIESKKEYVSIVTPDKSYLTKYQIAELDEQLPKENFLRVHRSFIVAKDKVKAFSAIDIEINKTQIPIGRSYKELVLSVLNDSF